MTQSLKMTPAILQLAVATLIGFSAINAAASTAKVIKTCSTTATIPGEADQIEFLITFKMDQGKTTVETQQTYKGNTETLIQSAVISQEKVRAGLTATTIEDGADELNMAELLVAHALMYTADADLGRTVIMPFDLKDIRSAKVFQIGEDDEESMGSPSVVEAYNQSGTLLGSFFGGFLVSPCR